MNWNDILGDGIKNLKVDKEIKTRRDKALNRQFDIGWSSVALEKQWTKYFEMNGQLKRLAMKRMGRSGSSGASIDEVEVPEDLIPEFDINVAMDLFPDEVNAAMQEEYARLEQLAFQNLTVDGDEIDGFNDYDELLTSLPDIIPTEFVLEAQTNEITVEAQETQILQTSEPVMTTAFEDEWITENMELVTTEIETSPTEMMTTEEELTVVSTMEITTSGTPTIENQEITTESVVEDLAPQAFNPFGRFSPNMGRMMSRNNGQIVNSATRETTTEASITVCANSLGRSAVSGIVR